MDFRLSEEQLMTQKMVREFAQKEVKPLSMELDAKTDPKECIPWELVKQASKLGLKTLSVPMEYGGGGADYITQAIVIEELGAADLGFAGVIRGNISHAARLAKECNEQQRNEFLPKFVENDTYLLAVARTEPNAGTDAHLPYDAPGASTQTYAERRGDEYIINGTKHFISNGGIAQLYFVYARTNKELPITQGLSIFLVPHDTPGFSIGRLHNKLGRRLLTNAELVFEDVRIPARNLVGKEGEALRNPPLQEPPFGLLGTAGLLGTLRSCYEMTLDYARTRVQGGKPIIEHPNVAIKLAEMRIKIEAARGLIWRCAWSWQNKIEYEPRMSLLIKGYTDGIALDIINQTVGIFGGMATDKSLPIEKYLRDIYTTLHGYGTTEMALLEGAQAL